jgi:hypothetical protein
MGIVGKLNSATVSKNSTCLVTDSRFEVGLPELVKQELWGILLTYNLVWYQMVQMCNTLNGDYLPDQLSFNGALAHIMRLIVGLPYSSPGAIPRQLQNFYAMSGSLILEPRRERFCPRVVKNKPSRYLRKTMPIALSERH